MSITIHCPKCKQTYVIDELSIGAKAQCEKCGCEFELSPAIVDKTETSISIPQTIVKENDNEMKPQNQQEETIDNSKLTKCADCGKTISKRATTCPFCGAPRQEDPPYVEQDKWHNKLKNCPNCGHPVAEEAYVCPNCGRQFSTYERTGIGSPLFLFLIFLIVLFLIFAFSI